MPKSKLTRLVEKFDAGDIDYDSLVEVNLDTSEFQGSKTVPVDISLADQVAEVAREKKTTVRKLLETWIRQNLRKLKAT
ncbi:MAG: hypothetical protein WA705_19490 [Candidatus Ozemobacteraceae bacterium]